LPVTVSIFNGGKGNPFESKDALLARNVPPGIAGGESGPPHSGISDKYKSTTGGFPAALEIQPEPDFPPAITWNRLVHRFSFVGDVAALGFLSRIVQVCVHNASQTTPMQNCRSEEHGL
jgi:hypothetical protein